MTLYQALKLIDFSKSIPQITLEYSLDNVESVQVDRVTKADIAPYVHLDARYAKMTDV